MLTRRIVAVLGISTAALLGATGVASATGTAEVPGGRVGYNTSANVMKVFDTACDNHRVYAKWRTNTGESGEVRNDSGCGSIVTKTINGTTNGEAFYYHVCVDDAGPNTCSAWVRDPHGA